MSAIFRTDFRDLQDAEGNNTKASTAKFVCLALADHANDEGEGAYPSIAKLSYKTNLSRTAVINALDSLKYNGILSTNGTSKWDTINYTVNPSCFSQGSQPSVLVNPLDSPSTPALPPPVNPLDPNHPLTIQEPSIEETSKGTAYNRGEQERPNAVEEWLKMANMPGAKESARTDALLSAFGVAFVVNSETAEWKKFAKYAISEQKLKGWEPERFIKWVKSQKGYPEFWSCRRMMAEYPKAFINDELSQQPESYRPRITA